MGKADNPMFTGDADMSWFDRLKESAGFQGKLRYPRQVRNLEGFFSGRNSNDISFKILTTDKPVLNDHPFR